MTAILKYFLGLLSEPLFLNDYTAAAKNFPMRRISSVFQTLRTIDVKSKGVGANLKPLDLYQELIFRILS